MVRDAGRWEVLHAVEEAAWAGQLKAMWGPLAWRQWHKGGSEVSDLLLPGRRRKVACDSVKKSPGAELGSGPHRDWDEERGASRRGEDMALASSR
jgi:hypothetical protein